jgi:hypothetical protein
MTQVNTPLTDPALPLTKTDINARLDAIEHHMGTVLFLSAVNLLANILTILVAFLAVSR